MLSKLSKPVAKLEAGNMAGIPFPEEGIPEELVFTQEESPHKILSIIWDNELSENGDIRREAHIRLRCVRGGLNTYVWRIPPSAQKRQAFGIRVRRGQELLCF